MNKRELVGEVASQTGLTKEESRQGVTAITSVITGTLARGEKVTLVDFGIFQVVERVARKGRNPQTGETLEIPAKKVPKFRPGKGLRKEVSKEV